MPSMIMDHAVDPCENLIRQLGNIEDVEVFNNQVLVAVYIRPNVTAGGVHLPDSITDEDRHQGKVGLIVGMGPDAFIDRSERWFQGIKISMREWIVFRPSEGWPVTVNGVLCRMLNDIDVKGRIARPDQVW